jgi:predicted nucleic acid-binding protein
MLVAVDTNVLAYAEGVNGASRRDEATDLLASLPADATLLPAQVLGELFVVLVRKARRPRGEARAAILSWGDAYPLIETTPDVILSALDLSAEHQVGLWDAVVLSAAADARCRLLLSEELQDGFTWRGVTVVDPFSDTPHPLLAAIREPSQAAAPKTRARKKR